MKTLLLILLLTAPLHAATWPVSEADCLAANIYHESRGESLAGQYMVAYTTQNRVDSNRFPNSYCGVVKQYMQFSWINDGIVKYPKDSEAWKTACHIATQFLLDLAMSRIDLSEGALYYHASWMTPEWAVKKNYIGRVGNHLFYR